MDPCTGATAWYFHPRLVQQQRRKEDMARSASRRGLRRLPGLVQAPAGSALLQQAGQALAVVRLLSACIRFGAPVVHPVQAAFACAIGTLDAGLQMSTCLLLVHNTK